MDTVLKITDYWAAALQDPQAEMNADFIRSYVVAGKLGVKCGRGFYEYPEPAYARPGFVDGKAA